MNPSMLELLCIDMRALGIRSLALELEPLSGGPLPPHAEDDQPAIVDRERTTLAPGDLEPPKEPDQCVAPGCSDKRGGLFGGASGGALCRMHALQRAGVRT